MRYTLQGKVEDFQNRANMKNELVESLMLEKENACAKVDSVTDIDSWLV